METVVPCTPTEAGLGPAHTHPAECVLLQTQFVHRFSPQCLKPQRPSGQFLRLISVPKEQGLHGACEPPSRGPGWVCTSCAVRQGGPVQARVCKRCSGQGGGGGVQLGHERVCRDGQEDKRHSQTTATRTDT